MGTLLQDLRYGIRMLARSPGFTLVAVLTLALGIGANTAMFSIVNCILLRPLPFPRPERIVQVLKRYKDGTGSSVSVPLFLHWRDHNQVFDHLAAFNILPIGFNLSGNDQPERVPGVYVTADFFQVFGVQPARGRGFLPGEDRQGAPRVAVLSDDLWRSRFGADPGLVHKSITLDGQPYTVIGIMPAGFRFPAFGDFGRGADVWAPFQLPASSRDPGNILACVARLKAGTTRERAESQKSLLTQALRREMPQLVDNDEGAALTPLHERLVGRLRPVLLILLGAVGFVLLIACANVANLLLARSRARVREMAVRTALGASRSRIVRQLLTESLLLTLLGGSLGLLLALDGGRLLLGLSPTELPRVGDVSVDWRVLGFTLLAAVATALLFGLTPAMAISKVDVNESLKENSSRTSMGGQGLRLTRALVVGETALSVILLAGAALLMESFVKLHRVKPGFDPQSVLTFETTLPENTYRTLSKLTTFYREVLQRLEALAGVESAATVTNLPTEFGPDFPFTIEGRAESGPEQPAGESQYRAISPDYFRAMRIPLLEGRSFTDGDTAQSPAVVIINATMARQVWPHQSPIGRTITIAKTMGPDWTDRPRQIVGVVGDVKEFSLSEPAPPEMFVPYAQVPAQNSWRLILGIPTRWVVRTKWEPLSFRGPVGRSLLAVDPNQPVAGVRSMEEVLSGSIARWRFNMLLLGIFAALAMVLAAVGIYGVVSYSVAQRTHEIGLRMALGAQRREVLRLVVGQGMTLALVGVAIGIGGALGLTRFLSSLLYGVKPTDPFTYVVASLILGGVALLACYIPARRATKVDPMVALRYE